MKFIPPNPQPCTSERQLPQGLACCEFPAGHVGPHRATSEPSTPVAGLSVWWRRDWERPVEAA